jgi:serine/threonine protein kinase
MSPSTVAEEDDLLVRARARVGTVLEGKYRLDRVLGVGGMAAVYQATHTRNAGKVAVKILHREVSIDRDLRARFVREGYIANTIDHPGVVRVLDDDLAEDGSVFLVMELLDGETLDARWERFGRRLRVGEVVSLMVELLDVLVAAHAKGITWRDAKPENLFLTRDGRLKVLDMGIARMAGGSSPTRTRSGAVFGTPAFMSPEQALGRVREVDHLSDIWAVGATAFTLLTGRFVHQGETAEEMIVRAATTPVPPLASIMLSIPESVARVIDRALSFDRGGRWPSARAMKEALVQAQSESIVQTADDFGEDERTKLAPAPKMTLKPELASGPQEPTVPLPTLPAVSTVGGVASNRERHARSLLRMAVVALLAELRGLSRRASSTVVGLRRASSTIRHRRKLVGAAVSGLLVSVAVGTVVVLVARAGGSSHAASATSVTPSTTAIATGSSPVSPALVPPAASSPTAEVVPAPPPASTTVPAPPIAPTPTRPAGTSPRRRLPPPRRDPLAP